MSQILTERATSFSLGVNDSTAPDEYQPQELAKLVNFRPSLQGNALERRGVTWSPNDDQCFGTNFSPLGGTEWELTSGQRQLVAISDQAGSGEGLFYSNDEGRTWTAAAGAINYAGDKNRRVSFATIESGGTNYLCFALGTTLSYKWDGTTLTALSNIPSGVKYLESFNNRLIAAGHSGTRVVASKVGDPDTWAAPDGWNIDASTSDGDNFITGLFQLGPVLMVFKRESVGYIEGFGFQTLQVQTGARGISRSVGCIGSHSIAPLGDYGVMWLSERGFETYTLNSGVIQLASRPMQGFVDAIMKSRIVETGFAVPQGVWLPQKREYWCAVPVGLYSDGTEIVGQPQSLVNNYIYCYRPGSATEPPAQWAVTFADDNWLFQDTGSSVGITSDTGTYPGALYIEVGSRAESQLLVGDDGALRVTQNEEFGLDVTRVSAGNDGNLGFGPSNNGTYQYSAGNPRADMLPQVMFTCDHDGQLSQPCFISYWGWFYYADDTQTTSVEGTSREQPLGAFGARDIESICHTRPLLFGDQFTRKQVLRARLQSSQNTNAVFLVRVRSDGSASVAQSLTQTATQRGRPAESKLRTKGKGRIIDVEIESGSQDNDSCALIALEVDARILRKVR
jgi:hypothetical protein